MWLFIVVWFVMVMRFGVIIILFGVGLSFVVCLFCLFWGVLRSLGGYVFFMGYVW